ncbi:hypothetical protein KKF34_00425 [Myxococcota bacterium]|nr:hypothetical protein [Myxococcota bacterium]MBU1382032.1 hypothetical protein [Myxococcota bacterium]MBU1495326.1 hypothetical protein [Myxococcota bacterium]
MKILEKIAYSLFLRGIISRNQMKNFIKDGFINYISSYMYDPMEKELSGLTGDDASWEYENWESDFSQKEKFAGENLDLFASRTGAKTTEELEVRRKPEIIEVKTLQKSLRKSLDDNSSLFRDALSGLLGKGKSWFELASRMNLMDIRGVHSKLEESLKNEQGLFRLLWDFVDFDGYVFPRYSGPVVSAYKKITQGLTTEHLGQYHWLMDHNELSEVYVLIQSQIKIIKAFGMIIKDNPDLFSQKLSENFHPLAYCGATIYYSALRWKEKPWTDIELSEQIPLWTNIYEVANDKAFTVSFFINSTLTMDFLGHYFRLSLERKNSLAQIMLKILFSRTQSFSTDLEKMEYIENHQDLILTDIKNLKIDVFAAQKETALTHPYWGNFFKSVDDSRVNEFIRTWWDSLTWNIEAYGSQWLFEERRWNRRVIGFEAYNNEQKFHDLSDPLMRIFHAIFLPASWNGVTQ